MASFSTLGLMWGGCRPLGEAQFGAICYIHIHCGSKSMEVVVREDEVMGFSSVPGFLELRGGKSGRKVNRALKRPEIDPICSWILVRFIATEPHWELPQLCLVWRNWEMVLTRLASSSCQLLSIHHPFQSALVCSGSSQPPPIWLREFPQLFRIL